VSEWKNIDGVRIHYQEAGSARDDSPVLLLVHGWAGCAADWEKLLAVLPPTLRAIAVDLPGCGLSDKPDAPYDMPFFLDALRSFCAALGLTRLVLAGHSMGGLVAVHFTARFPDMVEKLVLIDPYGLKGEEVGLRFLARLGPVVNLAFLLNTRLFIEWAMKANVLHEPAPGLLKSTVESTAGSILGREGARALARTTKSLIAREHVEVLLPTLSHETLLLWGEQDRLLPPRWAEQFASRLRSAEVHRIAGAGHMPMLEEPEAVAELITEFILG
jgi:pimeloyl-ACP methyl ester carboxylesterase